MILETYEGWVIESCSLELDGATFLAHPEGSKVSHDYDYENGSYQYCGNCVFGWTLDEVKDAIDEKIETPTANE